MSGTSIHQGALELLERYRSFDASERAEFLRAAPPTSGQVNEVVEAAAAQTWVDAREALAMSQAAWELANQFGTDRDRAIARWARARALAHNGRFDEAASVCQEAIADAQEAKLPIEAGRLRLVLMQALGELGRFDEAIEAGRVAKEIFEREKQPDLVARADINLGVVLQRKGKSQEALDCFNRARPQFIDQPIILGTLDSNRGEALVNLNDFSKAKSAFKSAILAFESAGAVLPMAIAEGNLADLAVRQGRLQEAMLHFEKARAAFESDDAPAHLARLMAEQAEALGALGLPEDSTKLFDDALPQLEDRGLALEAARARVGFGSALARIGREVEAERELSLAAASFSELGIVQSRARVDLVRAELALRDGRHAEAQALILRALAILHDRPADCVAGRLLLGRLAAREGRAALAEAELGAALAVANELDLAPMKADVLFARGLLRREQGKHGDAVADLMEAKRQAERVRGALQSHRFRAAFLGERSAIYGWLALCLVEQGDHASIEQAFEIAEQAKGRSLLEQMREAVSSKSQSDSATDSAEQKLMLEIEDTRAELSALYSKLGDDGSKANGHAIDRAWREAVTHNEQKLDVLQARLATQAGVGSLYAATATAAEVRAALASEQAIVEYFIAGSKLVAFVVRNDRMRCIQLDVDEQRIVALHQSLIFQIHRALRPQALAPNRAPRLIADVQHELRKLHDLLIAPLAGELGGVSKILLVPHGRLHVVPFHALWNGEKYLVEEFEIQNAPSASVWLKLTERKHAGAGRTLIVGVADQNAPEIEDEARAVATTLGKTNCDVLLGAAASIRCVKEASENASVLHLACHGRFAADAPLGSGLKLSDGWLTVRDIFSLRLNANLVTLSGCETGVNQVAAGDELMGLLRGFFAAGAKSMLVSFWQVDDQTTREFMAAFYGLLNTAAESARTKSRVLADTQRAFMKRHPHPAIWAPFALVGRE